MTLTTERSIEIAGKKCTGCGKRYAIPCYVCAECGGEDFESVSLGDVGSVYSFTVIRVPPLRFQGKAPYIVAVIDLEEGGRLPGVVEAEPTEVTIGKKVRAVRYAEGAYTFRLVTTLERE